MNTVTPPDVTFDAFDPSARADPYPAYRRVRDAAALFPYAFGDVPVTLITRYEECAAILTGADWGHGYAAGISPFRDTTAAIPGSFVRMDPPEHGRYRKLVAKAFTPRLMAELAPVAGQVVREIVDAALVRGELDVLDGLAVPLAVAMVPVRLLGADPADGAKFREWQLAIARGSDPDSLLGPEDVTARTAAAMECMGYFARLVQQKKQNPTPDLLSALVAAGADSDQLTEPEVIGMALLTLVAGMETSINLIGNGMLALLRNPGQLALLRDNPELIAPALDEMLRYDAPTQFTIRVALADTTVGEHQFRRGDGVVVLTASASRDDRVYPDADSFDVTRYAGNRPARKHLGFSLGIHYCVGAPLARIEAEAAVGALLARAPKLAPATDAIEYRPSLIHRGIVSLPVTM
ncbi:cytochrome P450 [Nocardia abscessus]|uniref:cytochrome P450 n=1 Tax=Nocardia TaxID=1817 RepID=UPI00189602E8|nr:MULTISPECIES: cytochrome P450 [Nocardia]MBF6220066.1 cytochrome P450 [Nocardia abscessus]MDE1673175.1 cytochrome P450 [Nocardia gipuzkoensis]UGT68720.1 cytochrome P450 [Nocardia gipuzkoensis]